MARHLMAVCVVCLLCAEHLPCKEHFEKTIESNKNLLERFTNDQFFQDGLSDSLSSSSSSSSSSFNVKTHPHSIIKENIENRIHNQHAKRKGRTKNKNEEHSNTNTIKTAIENTLSSSSFARTKRHADHFDDIDETSLNYEGMEQSRIFVQKIFQQFGDADGTTMSVDGFERMVKLLRLYSLIEEKIPKDKNNQSSSSSSDESCISSVELINRLNSNPKISDNDMHDTKLITNGHSVTRGGNSTSQNGTANQNNNNNNNINKNNSNNEYNQDQLKATTVLNFNDMYAICPILLYQMTAPTSLEKSGCIQSSLIPHKTYVNEIPEKEDRLYVWIYASVSILGVSLVGLLGVAVIPCMDRHFYQHAIQFLVALAVGTLAGDALLHLLPHSMMTFTSKENSHASMTWKGLISVLGIIFFFAMERGLTMIAEWRKKIEKKEKPSSRVRVMRDPDSTSVNNSTTGDKLCKHKYSSYPYCYDEIAMETKDDHHHHHHHNHNNDNNKKSTDRSLATTPEANNKNSNHSYAKDQGQGDHNETAAQSLLPHNYTTISDSYSVIKEDGSNPDNNTVSTNLDNASIEGLKEKSLVVPEETYTIILREHESSHHGHSHKHGHVHSPPRSLSAVAWMVVMGDGLHNFTDGMAIGAAFSNNIAGGFSTAIAVFCHELPHELGDFAVLLKAGMSAKQAVYYNLLSSVLSFFGMVLGIIVGDTPEASAWIFACAAGMFIYIALVDMMPELTSTHNERCALSQCLLQLLGMSCGLGIMLIIALYEHDLKNMFSSNSDNHHDHHHHHH